MSPKRSDSLPFGIRRLLLPAALLAFALSASVEARLLFLEDPLHSFPLQDQAPRRLELGSEFFGGDWSGLRNTFRLDGRRGDALGWSLSIPWLYSSYLPPGQSGRDNLRMGGSVRFSGDADRHFSALAEGWSPLSRDELYPLQQRRAFVRLSLITGLIFGETRLRTGVAYRWELKGIGPDTFDAGWPNRYSAFFDLRRPLAERFDLGGEGGISVSDKAATWSRVGVSLGLRWSELWRAEFGIEKTLGNQDDTDLYDYRIGFRLLRSFPPPADAAQGGEAESLLGTPPANAAPDAAPDDPPADPEPESAAAGSGG